MNIDALIPREDFEIQGLGDEVPTVQTIQVRDLERNSFFYSAVRKPDFQRETSEWTPNRVVGLIETFVSGELIPAVILWKNRDLVFVIDGSHRLSALIAWVQDDYGDGEISQKFFSHSITDEQIKMALKTRQLVNKTIGPYLDHKKATERPEAFGPEVHARARRLGSLALQLQWVRGDATKAEDSFIRINQQAAIISPEEMELIKSRKRPNAIAARAIIRKGTGHKYWSSFSGPVRDQIESLAADIHSLLFNPPLRYPLTTLDLPAGGTDYSSTALRMVYDFINLSVGTPSQEDDADGSKTIAYLMACQRVARLVLSNHPSSLGLHPAIYFYSWTGKQQPILFLAVAEFLMDLERRSKLKEFISMREQLETFLLDNRTLVNQVVRKFGTKSSGKHHLVGFYSRVVGGLQQNIGSQQLVTKLMEDQDYSFLQPDEVPYTRGSSDKFSRPVKSGTVIKELLRVAPKCPICSGYVPTQAVSVDHVVRVRDGGSSLSENAQITHPFCNSGVKG